MSIQSLVILFRFDDIHPCLLQVPFCSFCNLISGSIMNRKLIEHHGKYRRQSVARDKAVHFHRITAKSLLIPCKVLQDIVKEIRSQTSRSKRSVIKIREKAIQSCSVPQKTFQMFRYRKLKSTGRVLACLRRKKIIETDTIYDKI